MEHRHKGTGSGNESEIKGSVLSREDRVALYLASEGAGQEGGKGRGGEEVREAGEKRTVGSGEVSASKTKPKKRRRI